MKTLIEDLQSMDISKHVGNKGIDTSDRLLDSRIVKAIDDGIYRKSGSLRLPLNSKKPKIVTREDGVVDKIYPPKLVFDDHRHVFRDGVVLIHNRNSDTVNGGI